MEDRVSRMDDYFMGQDSWPQDVTEDQVGRIRDALLAAGFPRVSFLALQRGLGVAVMEGDRRFAICVRKDGVGDVGDVDAIVRIMRQLTGEKWLTA